MKCVSIKISGKVQGVFFRASAKEQAEHLGIKGFVRNEHDGSVYAEVEGNDPLVDAFIEWCKQGPPQAKVSGIHVNQSSAKSFSTFSISR